MRGRIGPEAAVHFCISHGRLAASIFRNDKGRERSAVVPVGPAAALSFNATSSGPYCIRIPDGTNSMGRSAGVSITA